MEKTKNQIEIESILNSLPNLTNHLNWGWQTLNNGWLVYALDINGVVTALTFVPR